MWKLSENGDDFTFANEGVSNIELSPVSDTSCLPN